MRGHIIKRYKNSYTIVLNLGIDPTTGKRKQQWVSVKGTKKDAEKRLAELLHQLDTGTFMKPSKTTLAEYLERWLKDHRSNLSPRAFECYESAAKRHLIPALGRITLTQLRPEHIHKCYAEMLDSGLSARTVRYSHAVIHKALGTAVKLGWASRNVADGVDIPHPRRTEMKTWDEVEIGQFLEATKDSPYHALFYTALFTGMRRSELLALRWLDVNLMLGQVFVSRGLHQLHDGRYVFTGVKSDKSRRTVALAPSAIIVLREHRERQGRERAMLGIPLKDDDLVFSKIDGKPLRPNTISHAWGVLAAHAGIKVIRLHDGRHTHASIMLKQGIHPKIVQERLGHSNIGITLDTYSHVAPGLQEAAAMRFDEVVAPKHEKEVVRTNG